MQRRFLFLLNPKAGVQKGQPLTRLIQQRCEQAAVAYTIEHSRADADYNWLREKISNEPITDVIVAGGDGTISAVAANIRNFPINIGIIPRGSGNGLALAAGISKDANKALDVIFNGQAQPVDAFMINEYFSCMLSGLGFDAQIAHEFDQQEKRGFWKYSQLIIKNFFGIKTYPFVIKAKDVDLSVNAFFISIANSNQFGNHFTIAPKASLQDGLLDVVAVEKMNLILVVIRLLWHIRFGTLTHNYNNRKAIIYFQTNELVIYNPQKAAFHIDGDGKETTETFIVKVIPNAYSLLMP